MALLDQSVLKCLGHVIAVDGIRSRQVGNRARDFEDAVVAARAETQAVDGAPKQIAPGRSRRAEARHQRTPELRVHARRQPFVSRLLRTACSGYALTDDAGGLARPAELAQASAYIDDRLKGLVDREGVIGSVRTELDAVHQISAKSREDLQFVTDHRDQVTGLRRQVQELLALAAAADDKIASIDARRRDVEEVQSKTTLISNLLEDVRVNLETVSEQKAMVDHLTEKLSNVQFVMQEAQNTLRMLSQERELAERIEQSIRQLRSRSGGTSDEGRQTA